VAASTDVLMAEIAPLDVWLDFAVRAPLPSPGVLG